MRKTIYVLYRGDEVIDIGTKEELAKRHGVSAETISFYASPTHKARGKPIVAERVVVRE